MTIKELKNVAVKMANLLVKYVPKDKWDKIEACTQIPTDKWYGSYKEMFDRTRKGVVRRQSKEDAIRLPYALCGLVFQENPKKYSEAEKQKIIRAIDNILKKGSR